MARFCEYKCKKFYNFMPDFFSLKNNNNFEEIYEKLFIKNDVHFNLNGNKFIAENFLKKFKN